MVAIEHVSNVLRSLNVLIVDLDDQVASDVDRNIAEIGALASTVQSGAIGGTTGNDLLNENPSVSRKTQLVCEFRPYRQQAGDSQTGTTHPSELHKIV